MLQYLMRITKTSNPVILIHYEQALCMNNKLWETIPRIMCITLFVFVLIDDLFVGGWSKELREYEHAFLPLLGGWTIGRYISYFIFGDVKEDEILALTEIIEVQDELLKHSVGILERFDDLKENSTTDNNLTPNEEPTL